MKFWKVIGVLLILALLCFPTTASAAQGTSYHSVKSWPPEWVSEALEEFDPYAYGSFGSSLSLQSELWCLLLPGRDTKPYSGSGSYADFKSVYRQSLEVSPFSQRAVSPFSELSRNIAPLGFPTVWYIVP